MLKICHVTSGYHRTDARVFQRQILTLSSAGYEVCVLTNDGKPDEEIQGIKFFCTKILFPNRLLTILLAKYQFKKQILEIDADIYQLHAPELLPLASLLKRKGKKVFYDAHEDMPRHILEKEWLPVFLRKPIAIIVEKYMRSVFRNIDCIVTPHHHVLDDLKTINSNTHLIPNFPLVTSQNKFSIDDYLSRDNIICYSGTVYYYSNQELLISVLAKVDDIRYEIAGEMPQDLMQKLSIMDGFNKLKYYGRIPWTALNAFYLNATIGYVVYDYKLNLGWDRGSYGTNKIFEYMEAGLPIICTDYILWKEIIEKYKCGIYIEPNNFEQLLSAILFLINDREEAYRMGQAGRDAILTEFNWDKVGPKYVNLFSMSNRNID